MTTASASDVDDDDADATERVVAAAITQAVLDTDPAGSGPEIGAPTTGWLEVLRSTIGGTIQNYATRVATAFVRASGLPEAPWAAAAHTRAREATEEVLPHLADRVQGQVEKISGLRRSSRGDSYTSGVHDELTPEEVTRRVQVGSEAVASEAITEVRELTRFEIAQDMGAIRKVWRTRRDARVRPTHGGLEGVAIPINQRFVTHTGALLMHPGDVSAPISEWARCRCRLAYRIPPGGVVTPVAPV